MNLRAARCLVTGASSGIGRAIAFRLASEGAGVCLHGRDETALAALASQIGGCPWVAADLACASTPSVVAAAVNDAFGGADVIVNNAGIGWAGPFDRMSSDEAVRLINVNLTAPILLTRLLIGPMLDRGRGHVVFVGSIAGHLGVPLESVYSATKAGLVGLADALRGELAHRGVSVSLISPGVVNTGFFERRGTPYKRSFPHPIEPDRVAAAVVDVIRRGRPQTFVPGWLTVPARLKGAAPEIYRRLSARTTRPREEVR